LIAVNDYFQYQDSTDNSTVYSPKTGFLMIYPSEKKVENSGIVRAICKHPIKDEIIIAYYNYESDSKTNQYAIEIRNTQSLEVVKQKKISGVIKKIIPSKDGELWQITIEEDINQFKTVFIDYETLEEKTNIDAEIE